ncbi:MAG: hypothetical protein H7X75_00085 [Burkholderiaceae bacterium]|nr:hypothetical protein [Burkholderiaceae bacterium]
MLEDIKLASSITVAPDDVERALLEHARDEPAVARVCGSLRMNADLAADELNLALDVDVLEVFSRAWVTVPPVRRAVQLSALTAAPPAIIRLDEHVIRSTSYPVLGVNVAGDSLPELRLTLELVADIQSATVAACDGQVELVAINAPSVSARLSYKSILLKEHATHVEGSRTDPFRRRGSRSDRKAKVDFSI